MAQREDAGPPGQELNKKNDVEKTVFMYLLLTMTAQNVQIQYQLGSTNTTKKKKQTKGKD